MKCSNYISSQFLALAVPLIVTLLAQVHTSHGLNCYNCVFVEYNGAAIVKNNSATCEKNPTEAELIPVTRASLANSAAVLKVLKEMGASQEVNPLLSYLPAAAAPKPNNPSSISSTNQQRNPASSVVAMDGNLETDATSWLYCSLSTFNIPGFGRVVLRSAAEATKDLGATYCDNTMIPGTGFEFLAPTNVSSCICRVSECNGKTITAGADKAGQSIAFLVFSIGLAILALTSFGQ